MCILKSIMFIQKTQVVCLRKFLLHVTQSWVVLQCYRATAYCWKHAAFLAIGHICKQKTPSTGKCLKRQHVSVISNSPVRTLTVHKWPMINSTWYGCSSFINVPKQHQGDNLMLAIAEWIPGPESGQQLKVIMVYLMNGDSIRGQLWVGTLLFKSSFTRHMRYQNRISVLNTPRGILRFL